MTTDRQLRDYVRESCAASGVAEFVSDAAVIDRAVAIVRPALQKRAAERKSA